MPNHNGSIMPGLKPVIEMLQTSPERIARILVKKNWTVPSQIHQLARKHSVPLDEEPPGALDRLCAQGGVCTSHQGVVAIISQANFVSLPELVALVPKAPLPLIIALDQIQDPGNLGVLARTAWALGCAGLLVPEHGSASPGPGAMRSSAGALARLPICTVTNLGRALDETEEAGLAIYGSGLHKAQCANAFLFQWQLPAVLALGSEGKGLRPGIAKRCSTMLAIPLARQFDSLNVAQAGAILMALCASATVHTAM